MHQRFILRNIPDRWQPGCYRRHCGNAAAEYRQKRGHSVFTGFAFRSCLVGGKVTGLRARNDFTIDMEWKKHRLVRAVIVSNGGHACSLQLPEGLQVYDASGKKMKRDASGKNAIRFQTVKGGRYILR